MTEMKVGFSAADGRQVGAQARGRHHQYPDGFVLYCGTMFAPVQDRDGPGQGFTHHLGDVVTIAAPELGALTNTVRLATEAPEWTFGTGALMRNLGIAFTEIVLLEDLAADCADDGQWKFLYTAAPLKIVGGSGAPVNPIVIK